MDNDQGIEKEAISFIPSEEIIKPSYLEVKYTISGSGFKTQLPIFKGGSAEELLRFLNEFQGAKTRLGYTTYQKLESGIEQLLQGTAKDEWSTVKGTVQPNTNTIAVFNQRIEAFKTIYIPEPAAVENQKAYLQRVRKNDKLTVPQFLDRIKQINLLLAQFPNSNHQQCFTNEEIKRLFYFAMPMKWRTNFINSGQSLHTTTLEALKTYMVYQEQQTDALRRKKSKDGKKNQNKNFSRKATSSNGSNRSPAKSNSKKRKRLSNDDDCPIHGTAHKWGQCHQNQYGDNFRPRRQAFNTNASHLSSTQSRASSRSGSSSFGRNRPPTNQVNFYRNQQYQRSTADSTNSYLTMPSHTQYNGDADSTRDNNQGEHYYVSYSTTQDDKGNMDHLPEGTMSIKTLNGIPVNLD